MPFWLKKEGTKISITALGGIDGVGRANCYLLETPEFNVMLDCGSALNPVATNDLFAEVDDTNVSYPDFESYIEKLEKVKVILVSHGHLDHAGALIELYKVLKSRRLSLPTVIMGQLIRSVLDKLFLNQQIGEELKSRLPFPSRSPFPFCQARPGQPIVLSEELTIIPIRVPHSFPESFGFYVELAGEKIFYSGDFKVNDVDEQGTEKFKSDMRELSRKGIDVLLLETTNIEEEGFTPSDREVWKEFPPIFTGAKGRIIFTTFSSHLKRIAAVIDIAKSQGRPVYACGRNLLSYLRAGGIYRWRPLDKFTYTKPEPNALILVTGCEAEPSSVLVRALQGEAPFELERDDTIIISVDPIPIPEIESRVREMVRRLLKPTFHGAEVFEQVRPVYINQETPSDFPTEAIRAYIHVSGHGKREDLKWVIKTLNPKMVIPVHGDAERIKTLATLAREKGCKTGILEKGAPLDIA